MESLKKMIAAFQGKKILVIGDLMLDEHIWSTVSRISPEAPVPVAEVSKVTHVPGGCGNVAANIAALGGIPYLVGIIGQDSSGKKLTAALKQRKVPINYLISDRNRPTILKSRIIAAGQQVVRVDREDRSAIPPKVKQQVLSRLKALLPKIDGVIISDYDKGMITKELAQLVIKTARRLGLPVTADPKGTDYSKYDGATLITPNLREAGIASRLEIKDEKTLQQVGKQLRKKHRLNHVLITRGKDGMSLFGPNEVSHIPAIPREVFDITGAGDSVIATLTLALSAGSKAKEASTLANFAGSVVVAKLGTAPCSRQELEIALEGREPVARKIKSRSELAAIVQELRQEGLKLVFTNGCFDLLHLGHVRYLREAKKLGDILIVGLNSDASVRALKGAPRPYVTELERAEILASMECVDYVVLFNELAPDNLIKIVRPDLHVKGGDYDLNSLPEKKLVEKLGGRVVVIPPIKGRSTTNIVDKILGRR